MFQIEPSISIVQIISLLFIIRDADQNFLIIMVKGFEILLFIPLSSNEGSGEPTQTCLSLCCSRRQSVDVDEDLDQAPLDKKGMFKRLLRIRDKYQHLPYILVS